MKHLKSGLFAVLLCSASVLAAQELLVVAPGIQLPASGAVFALDTVENKPILLPIPSSLITYNPHKGSNALRRIFYIGPRTSIDLAGAHAKVAANGPEPAFYVRLYGKNPESLRSLVKLVRLHPGSNCRVVSQLYGSVFSDKKRRVYDDVPVARIRVADPTWIKLAPQGPLEPGEYSIVFMPQNPAQVSHAVYDFRIDTAP
ncbi:MAG: hypothetical protein FWD64_08090, partial [Acidobacteriaceae bacterium]|nr:hypothetical protein [Acidobacteriaceae bacterium]